MRARIFRAFVFWNDGGVEDADEIEVLAVDEEAAKSAAMRRWRTTVGIRYPQCCVVDVEVERKNPCGGVAT